MRRLFHYLAFPFYYLAGVILLIYFLPSIIRDLQAEEKARDHFYR